MRKLMSACCILMCILADAHAESYEQVQQQCMEIAAQNPPQVEIIYNYGKLRINTDFDQEQLQKFHYDMTKEKAENLNGLTSLQPSILLDGLNKMDYRVLPNGYYCLFPTALNVKVYYEPVIYILKTISKGTCRYNLTLRHEYTHADIGYTAMNLLVQALKNQLPLIAMQTGVRAMPEDKATAELAEMNDAYQAQAMQIWNLFQQALKQQHQKLDVHETYARETAMCK